MRRQLAKIPFFGTLFLYHCDGCGRRRVGWEDRVGRRWAEHVLSVDELDPGAGTVLHECPPCRRAWDESRLAQAKEESRVPPSRETGAGNKGRSDDPAG